MKLLATFWDYDILLQGFYVGPEGSCKHQKLLLVADLDIHVHDITWSVYVKGTFLRLFYGTGRRIIYHFERSVSLTHMT